MCGILNCVEISLYTTHVSLFTVLNVCLVCQGLVQACPVCLINNIEYSLSEEFTVLLSTSLDVHEVDEDLMIIRQFTLNCSHCLCDHNWGSCM